MIYPNTSNNIQFSNELYGEDDNYEKDYVEDDHYVEEDDNVEDDDEGEYVDYRELQREIDMENDMEEIIDMSMERFEKWNDMMNEKYNKLHSLLEKFDFVKSHPNFTIHGGWIDSKDTVTEEEKKEQFNEYLSFAKKTNIEEKQRKDTYECDCMNWLFHRNIDRFNAIKYGLTKEKWFDVYYQEKVKERAEENQKELEQSNKILDETRRNEKIKKGFCCCDGNVCSCGAARHHHNYRKKLTKRIQMLKQKKKQREDTKQKKRNEMKKKNRELFLKKKERDETLWKGSINYNIQLEKSKKNNCIIEPVSIESDIEEDEEEKNDEEKEQEEKEQEEMRHLFMKHIIKKEVRETQENEQKRLMEIEEKTWKSVKANSKKKPEKKADTKKFSKKVSLECFNKNDYSEKKKNQHVLMCTRVCQSVTRHIKCRFGKTCRFAHKVEQLRIVYCKFNKRCKNGSKCAFMHNYESLFDYYKRQGFDVKMPIKKVKQQKMVISIVNSRKRKQTFEFLRNGEKTKLSFRDVLVRGLNKKE